MEGRNNTLVLGSTFSLVSMGFITWLVFLILKVTGAWNISWFWVWFPFWLPWAIELGFLIIIFLVALVVFLVSIRMDD